METKIKLEVNFGSPEELADFIADINGVIEYCTDQREADDYEENPHQNHVFQRANRVLKCIPQ